MKRMIPAHMRIIMALLGFVALAGCAATKTNTMALLQQDSDIELKLYVLDCGTVQARDLSLFNPGVDKDVAMDMAVPCYVIKHPEKGILVWDAGLSDSLVSEEGGLEVYQGAFNLVVKNTMLSQLQEIGIEMDEVTYFAPSHLHFDHSGNANYFSSSTLLMQQVEYDIAFSTEATKHSFDDKHYSKLQQAKHIGLQGDYDVFGDGSVVILSTPGHSPGHQSLYLKLQQTGPVILTGDLYHVEKNRKDYGIPVWNDKKMTVQSFAKIDRIIEQTAAALWIQHDPEEAKTTRLSPEFYQ